MVLDHTSGFEGLLFVDDDLLGVRHVMTLLEPFILVITTIIITKYYIVDYLLIAFCLHQRFKLSNVHFPS